MKIPLLVILHHWSFMPLMLLLNLFPIDYINNNKSLNPPFEVLLFSAVYGAAVVKSKYFSKPSIKTREKEQARELVYRYIGQLRSSNINERGYQELTREIYGQRGNDMVIQGKDYKFEFFNPLQVLIIQHKEQKSADRMLIPSNYSKIAMANAISSRRDRNHKHLKRIVDLLSKDKPEVTSMITQMYKLDPLSFLDVREPVIGCLAITYHSRNILKSTPEHQAEAILFKELGIDPKTAQKSPEVVHGAIHDFLDESENVLWSSYMYQAFAKLYLGSLKFRSAIDPLNAIIDKRYCVYKLTHQDKALMYLNKSRSIIENSYQKQFAQTASPREMAIAQKLIDDSVYLEWLVRAYEYNYNFMKIKLSHDRKVFNWEATMLQYLDRESNSCVFHYKKVANKWILVKKITQSNAQQLLRSNKEKISSLYD